MSSAYWIRRYVPAEWEDVFGAKHRYVPRHQIELYRRLDREHPRQGEFLPRDHGKTHCITIGYAGRRISTNHNIRAILASWSDKLSIRSVDTLKAIIETNQRLRSDFGIEPDPRRGWRSGEIYIKRTNPALKDPTYAATSVGAASTGFRFDIGICDDLCNVRNESSEVESAALKEWFWKTFLPQIEPTGQIIVIGTRKSVNDLYGAPLDRRTGYEGILRKDTWHCTVKQAIIDEKAGEVLWPEYWPLAKLVAQRQDMGPYAFEQEYQNNPTPIGGGIFKRDWLRFYTDLPKAGVKGVYMAVDPASGRTEASSFWAIVTIMVSDTDDIYVLDIHRDRMDPAQGIKRIWEKQRQYRATIIGVEAVFHQDSLLQWMDTLGINLPVIPLTYTEGSADKSHKKLMRIQNLVPYFARGQIHLSTDTQAEEFIMQEYLPFPDAIHLDRLDALEMAVRIIPRYQTSFKWY